MVRAPNACDAQVAAVGVGFVHPTFEIRPPEPTVDRGVDPLGLEEACELVLVGRTHDRFGQVRGPHRERKRMLQVFVVRQIESSAERSEEVDDVVDRDRVEVGHPDPRSKGKFTE